jgi:hypothetical protein
MKDELSEIKSLSGINEVMMPHDAEITPEEAFAMIKQGRWDQKRFINWLQSQNYDSFSDDWAHDAFSDSDYQDPRDEEIGK